MKFPAKLFFGSFLSLFILSACNEGEQIGLDIQNNNQLLSSIFTDTLSIQTSIIKFDSINTTNTSRILVGSLNDSRLGNTTATSFTQISVGLSTDLEFGGSEAVYDSIVMQLQYDYVYGDLSSTQTLKIHELSEKIDTVNYFNSNRIEAIGDEIGSYDFSPIANDTTNIVSFRISDDFGQKIFDVRGTSTLADQESFVEFVRGIRLSTESTGNDAIIGFQVRTVTSNVTLYYREPSDDGTLVNRTFRFSFGRGFHNINTDVGASDNLTNLSVDDSVNTNFTNNECFIQSGTGITTKVFFPTLNDFLTRENILINRAELFFRPISENFEAENQVPPSLITVRPIENGEISSEFLLNELSGQPISSTYNSAGRGYPKLDLTFYLQDILNGNIENEGFVLTVNPTQDREEVNRVILGDADFINEVPMQLQIFYTVLE